MRFDLDRPGGKSAPPSSLASNPENLDDLFSGLSAPDTSTQFVAGVPLMLDIDSIDEQADQPRQEFDKASLDELAETIRDRGVRQPISVHPNPQRSGRWILNFGARRLRASKMAGKREIPAFVDNVVDSYDQVIENEQRVNLSPLELALFVQRRLALGEKQIDIARRLGKARSYIARISVLIDPPDWLLDLYRSGRCRGVAELYELRRLGEADPQAIQRILADDDAVSRGTLAALKHERMTGHVTPPDEPPHEEEAAASTGSDLMGTAQIPAVAGTANSPPPPKLTPRPATEGARRRKFALLGEVESMTVSIVLQPSPIERGQVFIVDLDGRHCRPVALGSIQDLRIEER